MADFSFLSDTDDSAVEELISQAQDLCVLEQISAINCSGFNQNDLPSELETRFRKLKSFPVSKQVSKSPYKSSKSDLGGSGKEFPEDREGVSSHFKENAEDGEDLERESMSMSAKLSDSWENESFSPSKRNSPPKGKSKPGCRSYSNLREYPNARECSRQDLKHGSVSSPSASSSSSVSSSLGKNIFSPGKHSPGVKGNSKPRSGSLSSSPPQKIGCFCCSPKKSFGKKNKNDSIMSASLDLGKDCEFLADSSVFSLKEQQKVLRKALKEEERLNREAEKIVKWAKQASARMSSSGIDDDLSDNDCKL